MQPVRVKMADVPWQALPQRRVREVLSARQNGAQGCSLRVVEIRRADPLAPRVPHVHRTMEEILVIMAGHGFTWVEGRWWPVAAGDALLIPRGAAHGTVNPGSDPFGNALLLSLGAARGGLYRGSGNMADRLATGQW